MAGATPTELLAGDARRLEESHQRVAARMETLMDAFHEMRNDVTGFRSAAERDLKLIRWVGVFFAGVMVALVLGSGHVVWDAATITADVKQQGERSKDLTSEVKAHGVRLDRIESRLDAIDGRLDAMAKLLETLVRQTAPKAGG